MFVYLNSFASLSYFEFTSTVECDIRHQYRIDSYSTVKPICLGNNRIQLQRQAYTPVILPWVIFPLCLKLQAGRYCSHFSKRTYTENGFRGMIILDTWTRLNRSSCIRITISTARPRRRILFCLCVYLQQSSNIILITCLSSWLSG